MVENVMHEQGTGESVGRILRRAWPARWTARRIGRSGRRAACEQPASGVIWAADGLIVTADHVDGARSRISRSGLPMGGRSAPASSGAIPERTWRYCGFRPAGCQAVEHGPAPKVGHLALVVGRPGDDLATSIGVVSALGGPVRTWRGGRLESFIRTDATSLPGLLRRPTGRLAGQMVGLATSRFGQGAGRRTGDPTRDVARVVTSLRATAASAAGSSA